MNCWGLLLDPLHLPVIDTVGWEDSSIFCRGEWWVWHVYTLYFPVFALRKGALVEFVLTLQMFNERAATAAGCPVLMTWWHKTHVCSFASQQLGMSGIVVCTVFLFCSKNCSLGGIFYASLKPLFHFNGTKWHWFLKNNIIETLSQWKMLHKKSINLKYIKKGQKAWIDFTFKMQMAFQPQNSQTAETLWHPASCRSLRERGQPQSTKLTLSSGSRFAREINWDPTGDQTQPLSLTEDLASRD